MKKLLITLAIACSAAACGQKMIPREYVTISGKITNRNSDSLLIGQRAIIKKIKVVPDGTFSDTLKVKAGYYMIFDGYQPVSIYLRNGYDLNMSMDGKKIDQTVKYKGFGSAPNNYLIRKELLQRKLLVEDSITLLKKSEFETRIAAAKKEMYNLLDSTKDLDTSFVSTEKISIDQTVKRVADAFEQKQFITDLKGKLSPRFINYENYKGGTLSLDDLKGKYVYIDLWATWCGPCKAEIPYLKEIEKKYHSSNIEFVSISIDKKTGYEKWKKAVREQELSGIQLYSNEDKSFMEAFKVTGIPRFILIDPKGVVVSADAPRPSEKALVELLSSLNI